MKRSAEITSLSRRAMLAVTLGGLLSPGAGADLVGNVKTRSALAGKSEDELISANPVLERLARENPELLREVLERLQSPVLSFRRSLTYEAPRPATEMDSAIIAENPDLAVFYRESPEAALDLLRLIREAAKNGE